MSSTRASIRAYSSSRSRHEPDEPGRAARLRASTAGSARRAARAPPCPAARARARCGGGPPGRCSAAAQGARCASSACSGCGPGGLELGLPARAHVVRRAAGAARARPARRAGRAPCRRRRSASRPAPAARRSPRGRARRTGRRENVASTGTIETSWCSRRARSAAVGTPVMVSRPCVDLQRVGRDGDRRAARRAQHVGDAERDRGLPDAGRPEEREQPVLAGSACGSGAGGGNGIGREYRGPHERAHRLRAVDGLRRANRCDRGGHRRAPGARGAGADLVIVFCSGAHLAEPEATLEGVHEALAPAALVGCGAGGVLGAGREIEGGTARGGLGRHAGRRPRRDLPRARAARPA